jgi:large subunit ribosomal protein L25
MVKELQQDPVSRKALHIDFVRIEMTEKIRVKVSVEVVGVAAGVKTEGGILDFVTREIEVECLPGNIPKHIPVDVTALAIGDAIRVLQLLPPEGVTIVDDPEKVVVHVTHPTAEKEPEVVAAEAAEITEPEVLKKGKAVTEEEGEEKDKEKDRESRGKETKEKKEKEK